MDKRGIIGRLAEARTVERIVGRVLRVPLPLSGDAADLAQIVYLALLNKPDGWIEELAADPAADRLDRYVAGIVMTELASRESNYHRQIRRFARASRELTEKDTNTDIDAWERHG